MPAIVTCVEAAHNHNNGTGTATVEAAQDDPIQHTKDTATGSAVMHHTCHTTNPLHTAACQATILRITVITFMTTPLNVQVWFTPKRITQFRIILQPGQPKVPPKEE